MSVLLEVKERKRYLAHYRTLVDQLTALGVPHDAKEKSRLVKIVITKDDLRRIQKASADGRLPPMPDTFELDAHEITKRLAWALHTTRHPG